MCFPDHVSFSWPQPRPSCTSGVHFCLGLWRRKGDASGGISWRPRWGVRGRVVGVSATHSYKCCLRSCALSLARAVGGTSGCHGVLACRMAAAEGAQNTAPSLFLLLGQTLIFPILHLPLVVPCGPSSWTPLRPGMKRKGTLRVLCTRMSSTSRSARRAPGRLTRQSWGAVLSLLVLEFIYSVSV